MRTFTRYICLILIMTFLLSGCVSPESATTNLQGSVSNTTQTPVTDPEPTVPTTIPSDPTQPATQPTEPATQPTEPATQPTEPATQPTEPPTQPTEPSQPPTDPTEPEDVLVESISLSAPKTTIQVMEQLQITAAILPENAAVLTVMYYSTGGQVLDNGVFFAAEPGVYVVTAYAMDDSGVSGSITIIVEAAPVTGIAISGGNTVAVGKTLQLSAVVSPEYATDPSITWSIISGNDLATIDQNGLLTAIAAGKVTVQAAANDGSGVMATHDVEITPVLVTSITISGSKKVTVGDTLQLKAEVMPVNADNASVTWSIISGNDFATIDQNGLLTAIAPGKVTVQVEANDGSGVKATHKVEVEPVLVNTITISGEKTVKVGKTIQLSVVIKPDDAANKSVKWSISKGDKYASITQDGVLTGIAAGSVTVKVTAQDGSGVSATFKITVEEGAMWEGSGTEKDPFLITCLEDLLNLQNVTKKSGYYFRQVADIDCSSVENWIVIGDYDNPFRHNYDGGGYTISNLCLDGDAQALFSNVKDSHFKNMNIVNAHTKDNHRTEENRTGKYPGSGGSTGAIVGSGSGCSFENCTATVNFLSSNYCTGGLIGGVELKNEKYTLMKNCHVSGTITSGGYAGGLIGNISTYLSDGDYQPAETITIENCSADVEIIIFTISTERACVGGLIGKSFGVFVQQCHTTGTIDVIEGDIGGLIGDAGNYTDVTRCYSEMDIYASSDDHYGGVSIGGLIGHIYSRSDVYDCYATGNITAPYVEWSPCQDSTNKNGGPWRKYYNPCGSLIGTLEVFKAYSEDQKINVYNCYATGKVDVPNICEDKRVYCHGALIGLVLDRNTVLYHNIKDPTKKELTSWEDFEEYYIGHFGNNYNLEDLRTYYEPINDYEGANTLGLQNPKYKVLPTHDYVEIITEQQLLDQSIFEGWDFENIWIMTENGPRLR